MASDHVFAPYLCEFITRRPPSNIFAYSVFFACFLHFCCQKLFGIVLSIDFIFPLSLSVFSEVCYNMGA